MKFTLKVVGFFVGSFVVLVAVQIYQFIKVCDEKRNSAIQVWAENNEGGERILSAYNKCLNGPVELGGDILTLVSYTDCAIMAGSQSLADEIEKSTSDVSVSPPLSWL